MVRIGILYEGETEGMIFDVSVNSKSKVKELFQKLNLQLVGCYKYTPAKLNSYINSLINNDKADKIFILKDLEQENCLIEVKNNIHIENNLSSKCKKIIVNKMLEAWLIADNKTTNKIFGNNPSKELVKNPENHNNPFKELKDEFKKIGNKKLNTKIKITKKYIDNGFSIEEAAKHQNCKSANYFINKLKEKDDTLNVNQNANSSSNTKKISKKPPKK